MAECTSCGGFVTDDYVRVFGNNDNEIDACRSCRADRGSDREEEEEREVVLLRDVRGTDADQVGRRAGVEDDSEEASETTPAETESPETPATNAGSSSALDAIRSTLRSLSR